MARIAEGTRRSRCIVYTARIIISRAALRNLFRSPLITALRVLERASVSGTLSPRDAHYCRQGWSLPLNAYLFTSQAVILQVTSLWFSASSFIQSSSKPRFLGFISFVKWQHQKLLLLLLSLSAAIDLVSICIMENCWNILTFQSYKIIQNRLYDSKRVYTKFYWEIYVETILENTM